ncbi:MAG: uncharacterized protein V7637_2515 [Mycobacteriales bacterium]
MTPVVYAGLAAFAVVVGALIGGVGVGGVLLGPALVTAAGLDPHAATATCAWAFLFTGAVGTWRYGRRGDVPWPLAARVAVGALPAAVLGVWTNRMLPATAVLLLVAAVAVGAGANTLRPQRPGPPRRPAPWAAVGIGAAVGFGSALTGTGGPVLLLPALLALGSTPLIAVAVSQVVQLPVAGAAATAYLTTGSVRIGLGTIVGLAAAAGVPAGATAARRADTAHLRTAVGLACAAAGILLLLRIALTALSASAPITR